MSTKKATFCIATYNDVFTTVETIENLFETLNPEEIDVIIVDDSGNFQIDLLSAPKFKNVRVFRNAKRMGVGYSLDFAVQKAETDIVFPMGCDIRFSGEWFDRFYAVVRSHPESLVSTVTAGLHVDRRFITGKENHYFASKILFHVTEQNNRKKPIPYREYIEAKWNGRINGDVEEIGCILGAFYGCHRNWYLKIRGFEGHKTWGSLEPLISLRSYVAGGNCIIDTKTVTGHIFKTASSEKPVTHLVYNKLLIASTLLPKDMEKIVYDWAATMQRGRQAIALIETERALINVLADLGRNSIKLMGKEEMDEDELRRRIKKTGILNDFNK